jgi:hypothetical protein
MDEDNEIGRDLREAVANFRRALKRGDIDEADETQTKTAAILHEILEIIAGTYGLSRDKMCVVAMIAVSSMAQDAYPGTRSRLASYAALIDLEDGGQG